MSETLLFRYYRDKATLFSDMVIAPFHELVADFVDMQADPVRAAQREAETRRFTRYVYELFECNEALFRALLTGSPLTNSEEPQPGLRGPTPFFDQSVDHVRKRYEAVGIEPSFDLSVGVRLGFGVIASSVILRHALFPQQPNREALVSVLEHLIAP